MDNPKLIEYTFGDLSIKKVSNGWMLVEGSTREESSLMFSVYESDERPFINQTGTLGDAESLTRLLQDAFEGYLQSKHFGGISITFHEKGYGDEENNNEI